MENFYLNTNEHQRADVTVETRDARFVRDCQRNFRCTTTSASRR